MTGNSFLPPWLTLVACIAFIVWLFKQDAKEEPVGAPSLWVSGIWIFFLCSRSLGAWIAALFGGGGSVLEGNTSDILSITLLSFCAISIINRRGFPWSAFIFSNLTIMLLYFYFLSSAFWSEYPLVVVKRIVKDYTLIFLALLMMTEPRRDYAMRKVFLRIAYIIFPLSVVLIKWFPAIGRKSSAGGEAMMGGVTVHKNTLGEVLVVVGMILIWDLTTIMRKEGGTFKDPRVKRRLLLMSIGIWLLVTANSKTAVLCLILGAALFWLFGKVLKSNAAARNLILLGIVGGGLYLLDGTFHIKDQIIVELGRDPTLTGRTRIWEVVKGQNNDPIVGGGFMMFWDSTIGSKAREEIGVALNSAHSGYLEMFLDGGVIGIALLGLMLFVRGIVIFRRFLSREPFGRMAMIYFLIALLYNCSESNFFRLGSLWFMTLMAMMTVPVVAEQMQPVQHFEELAEPIEEPPDLPLW